MYIFKVLSVDIVMTFLFIDLTVRNLSKHNNVDNLKNDEYELRIHIEQLRVF